MRFDQIDLLRGFAVILVILHHCRNALTHAVPGIDLPSWSLMIGLARNAMTIFFSLSGFLITFISIRRFSSLAQLQPGSFYRMRFARIGPMMLLLLAILSVLHLAHVSHFVIAERNPLPSVIFATLTFQLNWFEATRGPLPLAWALLWSLSVEEMFYLFFPLVTIATWRWMRAPFLFFGVLLAFIAMGPFARTVWTQNLAWQERSYLSCMDAISMGCITALAAVWVQRRSFHLPLLTLQTAGGLLLATIALWPYWISTGRLGRSGLDASMLAFATCVVTFTAVLRRRPGFAWTAPLRWFGKYIYEIYLTHSFVVIAASALYARVQRGPLTLWILAMLAASLPLGWLFAHYFSEPLHRRLRHAPQHTKELHLKSA
jgi:peptidoglycan/LPS O-acetylase OafA/YrhL